MEIQVDVEGLKRTAKIFVGIFAFAVIGWGIYFLFNNTNLLASISIQPPPMTFLPAILNSTPTPPPTPNSLPIDNSENQKAVIKGIESLCKVSYSETLKAWSDRVCQVSSIDGCKYFFSIYGRNKWNDIQANKVTIDSCDVVSSIKVDSVTSSRITEGEIWHINVSGAEALGIKDNYALVVYDPVSGWLFERLLYPDEAKQYVDKIH